VVLWANLESGWKAELNGEDSWKAAFFFFFCSLTLWENTVERSLVKSAEIKALADGDVIAVNDSQVLSFVAAYATAFKLQGSSDDGSTYSDIAGSAQTSDGSVSQRNAVSLFRPKFDHIKVVMTSVGGKTAVAIAIRQGIPTVPPIGFSETRNETIINPQLGTA
jgi:hypothetical protein